MTKINLSPHRDRIEEAKERIGRWHGGEKTDRPPFLFTPVGFRPPYTQGEQAEKTECAVESALQEIQYQLDNFPDTDYVPFFKMPYLGEGIIPSMFGAEQLIVNDNPPFTNGRVLSSIDDSDRLPERINPERDGWGPRIREGVEMFLDAVHGEIPVGVVDHQSPYGIATKLLGNEELMLALYDEPEKVSRLLEKCRQATSDTIHAMENWAGDPDLIVKNYRAPVPGCGIILWDDYISVLSPDLHKRFCVPANNALYKEFGPGHLHTCGPYFPGYIDAFLCHSIRTVDTVITRDMKRLEEDYLDMKRIFGKKDILLYGRLEPNDIHILDSGFTRKGEEGFIREMVSDRGMFLCSGGTPEEGRKETARFTSFF